MTFSEIRDGEQFATRGGLICMKTPEINTPIGRCTCGVGMNAIVIGLQDGGPLTDFSGRPVLPWYVHFCPGEEVERLALAAWEVNASRHNAR